MLQEVMEAGRLEGRSVLTRIEIDGFKSFERFAIDVHPFQLVVGPNASGKSNLFDALVLLSRLADTDLSSAVKGLRGEPFELFRRESDGTPCSNMRLAVEVFLYPVVQDPWGAEVTLEHNRIRYEVCLEHRLDERGLERLRVTEEKALPVLAGSDRWPLAEIYREAILRRRRAAWLETTIGEDRQPSFQIRQDGRAGRKRSALAAQATVLSSITSAEFPHLFALREELRGWRFLQLDPFALRRPSPTIAPEILEPDGSNLAAVLARIKSETADSELPNGLLSEITADLSTLIPDVRRVDVVEDRKAREFRLEITFRNEVPFSSKVVSDGTLRLLALLTMLYDPRHRGLICFEEPENGIHPARLKAVVKLLKRGFRAGGASDLPKQVLLNSHSPVVLSAVLEEEHRAGEILFADVVSATRPGLTVPSYRTRMRPVQADRALRLDFVADRPPVSPATVAPGGAGALSGGLPGGSGNQ